MIKIVMRVSALDRVGESKRKLNEEDYSHVQFNAEKEATSEVTSNDMELRKMYRRRNEEGMFSMSTIMIITHPLWPLDIFDNRMIISGSNISENPSHSGIQRLLNSFSKSSIHHR